MKLESLAQLQQDLGRCSLWGVVKAVVCHRLSKPNVALERAYWLCERKATGFALPQEALYS